MGPGRTGYWQTCLVLVVGFSLCAGLFSLTIPVFEAPDEPSHTAVARYILAHGGLPVQTRDSPLGQEASQPPLYYLLGAALFALSPGPDLGWSNIPLPAGAYLLADLLGLLGVVGLVGLGWEILRQRDRVTGAQLVLLLGWVATVSLALVCWVQINAAAHQGRLLFPAAAAVGGLRLAGGPDKPWPGSPGACPCAPGVRGTQLLDVL